MIPVPFNVFKCPSPLVIVFANSPGDRGSIPGWVIPKTQKWYLMCPCLTLSSIKNVSRVKWSNPEKVVNPFPTPRCSSYWKGSLRVTLGYGCLLYFLNVPVFFDCTGSTPCAGDIFARLLDCLFYLLVSGGDTGIDRYCFAIMPKFQNCFCLLPSAIWSISHYPHLHYLDHLVINSALWIVFYDSCNVDSHWQR